VGASTGFSVRAKPRHSGEKEERMTKSNLAAVPGPPKPDFTHECQNNVLVQVSGDVLTVTVDLSKTSGYSSTGKTLTVGSTNGFLELLSHPGTVLSINVNRKVARR
jgi:hypothetical protein